MRSTDIISSSLPIWVTKSHNKYRGSCARVWERIPRHCYIRLDMREWSAMDIRTRVIFTRLLVNIVALCVTIYTPHLGEARLQKRIDVPAYFVFGDSFADVGTNNFVPNATALANFPPYGETYFYKPTGRFTNGRNIVDFFAQAVGLPCAPPYLQPNSSFIAGVNFASGGSGFLNDTNFGAVVPMSVQVDQFRTVRVSLLNKLSAWGAHKLISKSIFLVLSGSNDLVAYLTDPLLQYQMNATAYLSQVVGAYRTTLTDLYKSGARKAVVFGLAPLGCSPSGRAANPTTPGECLPAGNELALGFNAGVKQLVDALYFVLPDFNIMIAESYDHVASMINNKKTYGLENVSGACCGAGFLNAQVRCGMPMPPSLLDFESSLCKRPSKYLFWDVVHPTEQVVRLLFKSFWTGDSNTTYPMNMKALASL